jgi:hypothetical protein
MVKLVIGVVLCLLFSAALAQLLFWEAMSLPTERLYSENGYTEWQEAAMLLVCAVVMFIKGRSPGTFQSLAIFLALAFTFLFIRENDHYLDTWLFHGAWKYIALVPALAAGWVFFKRRDEFFSAAPAWSRTASFGVMLSGLMVLMFSRLYGRTIFWEAVMGDGYMRVVKNAAEEGVELMAMGLMLVAVFMFRPGGTGDNE